MARTTIKDLEARIDALESTILSMSANPKVNTYVKPPPSPGLAARRQALAAAKAQAIATGKTTLTTY